jgi:hypothetical protein
MEPWEATKIRYIKLGESGKWWRDCKEKKILRLGFNSGESEIINLSKSGDWDAVKNYWQERQVGTPTQHTNQMREFFEDIGTTLWITFEGGCLYYTFTTGDEFFAEPPVAGSEWTTHRKLSGDGWKNTDSDGNELRIEGLSGRLTKTAAYRQTICGLQSDVEEYLRNRLQCRIGPQLAKAVQSKLEIEQSIIPLVQLLTPSDFELLIELIFSNSGWIKTSKTGGNQRTTDLDLYNPITNQQIWVQVKSSTNAAQFSEYVEKHYAERSNYETMYFIYHSGSVGEHAEYDRQIVVWGHEVVSKQVVANGLIDWVLNKAK